MEVNIMRVTGLPKAKRTLKKLEWAVPTEAAAIAAELKKLNTSDIEVTEWVSIIDAHTMASIDGVIHNHMAHGILNHLQVLKDGRAPMGNRLAESWEERALWFVNIGRYIQLRIAEGKKEMNELLGAFLQVSVENLFGEMRRTVDRMADKLTGKLGFFTVSRT